MHQSLNKNKKEILNQNSDGNELGYTFDAVGRFLTIKRKLRAERWDTTVELTSFPILVLKSLWTLNHAFPDMPNAICYAIKMDRALYVSSFPFLFLLLLLLFSTLITKKKKCLSKLRSCGEKMCIETSIAIIKRLTDYFTIDFSHHNLHRHLR